MTEAEKKIWYRVRDKQLGVKFRRQQPIGNYVVDFVCFEKKLVIEIDGGEHSIINEFSPSPLSPPPPEADRHRGRGKNVWR